MKKNTHPKYQKVLFVDSASGHKMVIGSTLTSEAKETFEGAEYPVVYLSTSSSSHPFFTKEKRFADAAGRIERFNKRFSTPEKEAAKAAARELAAANAPAPTPEVYVPKAAAAAASSSKKPAAKAAPSKQGSKPAAPAGKSAAPAAKAASPKKK
jgi:large subunit ribosomal protein L31